MVVAVVVVQQILDWRIKSYRQNNSCRSRCGSGGYTTFKTVQEVQEEV